jgi:hypothetical protein
VPVPPEAAVKAASPYIASMNKALGTRALYSATAQGLNEGAASNLNSNLKNEIITGSLKTIVAPYIITSA